MDIFKLNQLAERMVEKTEADILIVLYNTMKGACVYPFWEMVDPDEDTISKYEDMLINLLCDFADESSCDENFGTIVYRLPPSKPLIDEAA